MTRTQLAEEALSRSIIGAFYEVYNTLGFGFLEHIYVQALEYELLARGHRVARELGVRVMYKEREVGCQRLDMVIDEKLVVETKSTYELHRSATRQLYNYLHATALEVGLLLHFGPEPKFYRVFASNQPVHPPDPPRHPDNPSSLMPAPGSRDAGARAESAKGMRGRFMA